MSPRHATLRMALATSTFDLTLHGRSAAEAPVVLQGAQVTTFAGLPVQPWDMHSGAVLQVLGASLMLRACSAATGALRRFVGSHQCVQLFSSCNVLQ